MIGGEPYVRPNLLKRIVGIIPSNWLITSGTSPLIYFDKTTHIISIDGKDAETHDRIRKSPGLFGRIVKNLSVARGKWGKEFGVIAHSVLNAMNYRQISDILSFWKGNGLVDGIMFSMATPIDAGNELHLRLSSLEHEWIMKELLYQKEHFKDFLLMSRPMIEHFDPDRVKKQRPETCRTSLHIQSFAADGSRIERCVLSPKADCGACGCVITGILDGIYGAEIETIKIINRMITV